LQLPPILFLFSLPCVFCILYLFFFLWSSEAERLPCYFFFSDTPFFPVPGRVNPPTIFSLTGRYFPFFQTQGPFQMHFSRVGEGSFPASPQLLFPPPLFRRTVFFFPFSLFSVVSTSFFPRSSTGNQPFFLVGPGPFSFFFVQGKF